MLGRAPRRRAWRERSKTSGARSCEAGEPRNASYLTSIVPLGKTSFADDAAASRSTFHGAASGARALHVVPWARRTRYAPGVIEAMSTFPSAVLSSIAVVVAGQQTLEDVVRWGLGQRPVRPIERVVV